MICEGCQSEMEDCYEMQQQGYYTGLEFYGGHVFHFSINPKTNKFIIPFYFQEK